MEYLNERYPYEYGDAIACFYSYPDTCILQGVISWDKKLIIVKEYWYQNASKTNVADVIKFTEPWINKNSYLADMLGGCYCTDFSDENDLMMLEDGFKELKDGGRIVYEAEKTDTKNRDKCLQILTKALSLALNSPYTTQSFSHRGNQYFPNPREIAFKGCEESAIKYPGVINVNLIKKPNNQINWDFLRGKHL